MSKPVSALNGAEFSGLATVQDCGVQGMISLRGDLSDSTLQAAVVAATGAAMPEQWTIVTGDMGAVAWMSPDELLVLTDYDRAEELTAQLVTALAGTHALAVNVSDARAMFVVDGADARDVLAKLCPVDFAPDAFVPGAFRRTRMAQIAAAIWAEDATRFRVVCFRSVGQYAFDLLKTAAAPGSAVGVF